MLDAKIEGLADLQKELAKVPQKIAKGALRSGVRAGAAIVGKQARINCPVRTGRLKKSIKWRGRKTKRGIIAAAAMATAPYSHLVEFGTAVRVSKKTGKESGQMPASRFMTRAADEQWRKAVDAVGIQVKKYLAKKKLR